MKTKPVLVGSHSKPCLHCGTIIHRNGAPNLTWIRRYYCSHTCAYAAKGKHTWKRNAWKN